MSEAKGRQVTLRNFRRNSGALFLSGLIRNTKTHPAKSVSELVGDDAYSANFEFRRLLMQAYQQSGIAKASSASSFLQDWLEGSQTQKILLFALHLEVWDTLEQSVAKNFKGVGSIRIDGSVGSKERVQLVKIFQSIALLF